MVKNQKGFHVIELIVVILVVGLVAFIGLKVFTKQNEPNPDARGQNYQALQACDDSPALTTLPMDPAQLEAIAPLGNIDPPDHTLPTDHMYMMYPYGTTDQRTLYAPANIVVTAVSYGSVYENGTLKSADYAVVMYPCSELKLIFGHVDTLHDTLAAAIGPVDLSASNCTSSTQGAEEITNCNWNVDVPLSAGQLIGTADGWDLWATYEGFVSPNVVSPAYYHNVDAVCPLDYFANPLKIQLYALVKRDGEPKCGQAYQDKPDTLQGGWFAHQHPTQAKTDWSSHFSLAHHSQESNVGILALASEDFMYRFSPRHSGTLNREPSETTPGVLYCYQHEGDQRMPNGTIAGTGKVLLKLLDGHTMQLEHQSGTCTSNESFSAPHTYYR